MDGFTFVTSLVSSVGISAATATWLSRQIVTHRLKKDFEAYKDKLGKERDAYQAELRQETETALGIKAAERDYALAARKRLYTAIGPLRFQLLLACRDLRSRIELYAKTPYATTLNGYYGRTLLYRILRPMAVSDLIERQIAYADFAVDTAAIEVLRFRRAFLESWTGGDVVLAHPAVNWQHQEQHVFSDSLRRAAAAIILRDQIDRVMYHSEFHEFLANHANYEKVHPFQRLLDGFSIESKPILWTRLVCAGLIAHDFVESQGRKIGFSQTPFPVVELLNHCSDEFIRSHVTEYEAAIRRVAAVKL